MGPPRALRPDSRGVPGRCCPPRMESLCLCYINKEAGCMEGELLPFAPRLGPRRPACPGGDASVWRGNHTGWDRTAPPLAPVWGPPHTAPPEHGSDQHHCHIKETRPPVSCPGVKTWMVKSNNNNNGYGNLNKTGERSPTSSKSGTSEWHLGSHAQLHSCGRRGRDCVLGTGCRMPVGDSRRKEGAREAPT